VRLDALFNGIPQPERRRLIKALAKRRHLVIVQHRILDNLDRYQRQKRLGK